MHEHVSNTFHCSRRAPELQGRGCPCSQPSCWAGLAAGHQQSSVPSRAG